MYLTKRKDGVFIPSSDSDYEQAKKIIVGGEVKATRARNPLFHRKAFALLTLAFQNQDRLDNFEVFRKVITIRAGYYDIAPTKDGEPYYIPKSLSYELMSAEDFDKWYQATLDIVAKDMETKPEQIQSELAGFY